MTIDFVTDILGSIWSFFAFVTATGLVAAIFNQVIDWFRDRKKRSRQASYLGLRLAAILELFVSDSLSQYAIMTDATDENGSPDKFSIGVLEEYPDDIEGWTSLPKDLAGKILNFRLNLIEKQRDLTYLSAHLDGLSLGEEYTEACIDMSADAWSLAGEIREYFDFPSYGKVNAGESNSRTGLFLENETNKLAHKRQRQGAVEN